MKKIILALIVLFSLQSNAQIVIADTVNLVVSSIGSTGTNIAVPRNDTLKVRKIVAGSRVTVDTLPTSEIRVRTSGNIQEVSDHAYSTENIYIYTPTSRLYYVINGYRFELPITDSAVYTGYDADAAIYMDAVELAGRTLTGAEKSRINTLFVGLKADGVFTLLIDGILPVWGVSAPSLVPLKATHTFSAAGSPTFGSDGIDFNGSNQFVITDIIPATHLPTTTGSMFYYSQENVTESNVDMGVSSGSDRFELLTKSSTTTVGRIWSSGNGQTSQTATSSQGLVGVVRASLSDLRVFRNGSQLGSTVTASTGLGNRPSLPIYIGGRNGDGTAGSLSTKKCSGAFVLQGMTPTQVADFTTRLEAFYDAMGIGVIP